jgi:hypothetical protein
VPVAREVLPLATLLPRAWFGFSQSPWRCVGLAALILIGLMGPGVLAHDLQRSAWPLLAWLGNLLLACSLLVPIAPTMALLQLADQLLSASVAEPPEHQRQPASLLWLWRQGVALLTLEVLILAGGLSSIRMLSEALSPRSGVLASAVIVVGGFALILWIGSQLLALPLLVHHRHRPLAAMEHSRHLVYSNRLKVLALIGLLLGLNALGLMGACLGLLISLPLSALVLMASCRTQTS